MRASFAAAVATQCPSPSHTERRTSNAPADEPSCSAAPRKCTRRRHHINDSRLLPARGISRLVTRIDRRHNRILALAFRALLLRDNRVSNVVALPSASKQIGSPTFNGFSLSTSTNIRSNPRAPSHIRFPRGRTQVALPKPHLVPALLNELDLFLARQRKAIHRLRCRAL